jgi:hypothetical protein
MFVSCEIGLFPASIIGIPADPEQVLHWRKSPLKAYYPKGCDDGSQTDGYSREGDDESSERASTRSKRCKANQYSS